MAINSIPNPPVPFDPEQVKLMQIRHGMNNADLGKALGVTRQRVWEILRQEHISRELEGRIEGLFDIPHGQLRP